MVSPRRRCRLGVLLAVGLTVTGCGPDSGALDWAPTNPASTVASRSLTGRVVSVSFMLYPEGSQVSRFLTTPTVGSASPFIDWTAGFDAFAAKLGWPLPEPVKQPRACKRGEKNYTVWVTLDSGQTQSYGPCLRPPLVDEATRLLNVGFP